MRFRGFGLTVALCMLSISLAGGGNAAARAGFSLTSLKGSYAGIFSGQVDTGTGLVPIVGSGIFVSDGHGNLSGHENYTVATSTCEAEISGTYTINPDGSGTDAITFTVSATSSPDCTSGDYTQDLAIAEQGKLILLTNTNGDAINEEWRKQK
jgi:hypothetical protein